MYSPRSFERGIKPDALTDQTSAHDPVNGYLPQGWSVEQWDERRVKRSCRHRRRGVAIDGQARRVPAALQAHGIAGIRLRQQHPSSGLRCRRRRGLRYSRFRARIHSAAVLPRRRAIPLGGALGQSGGHLQDRRQGQGVDSGRSASASMARHGALAHSIPGIAGAHLLGGPGPASSLGTGFQRNGEDAASFPRPS